MNARSTLFRWLVGVCVAVAIVAIAGNLLFPQKPLDRWIVGAIVLFLAGCFAYGYRHGYPRD